MSEIKENWQKKAKTIRSEILRLQARLAVIENYIENDRFPKQNGKKPKRMAEEKQKNEKESSSWF